MNKNKRITIIILSLELILSSLLYSIIKEIGIRNYEFIELVVVVGTITIMLSLIIILPYFNKFDKNKTKKRK